MGWLDCIIPHHLHCLCMVHLLELVEGWNKFFGDIFVRGLQAGVCKFLSRETKQSTQSRFHLELEHLLKCKMNRKIRVNQLKHSKKSRSSLIFCDYYIPFFNRYVPPPACFPFCRLQRPIGGFPVPQRSSTAAQSGSLVHFVTASSIVEASLSYVGREQYSFSWYLNPSKAGRASRVVAETPRKY